MEIRSLDELQTFARDFTRALTRGASATVVTLSGELGAGKTTFVQYVARALGVSETVTSPTFVLEKIYALEGGTFTHLVHIDAYRLKGSQELAALGWEALIADAGNLVLIEWPERVPELIPATAIHIRFDIDGDGRIITIDGQKENSIGEERGR